MFNGIPHLLRLSGAKSFMPSIERLTEQVEESPQQGECQDDRDNEPRIDLGRVVGIGHGSVFQFFACLAIMVRESRIRMC